MSPDAIGALVCIGLLLLVIADRRWGEWDD
jgi:hypothetical protein